MPSMDKTTHDNETIDYELYPFVTGKERLAVFEQARGMLKGRVKDILAELDEIKNEFDSKLPSIS